MKVAVQLKSTKDLARANGIKVLVYGNAGAGKTTLCATAEDAIIISAESGLLSLHGTDIPVIEVSTIADVHEAYQYLLTEEGQKYKWVCLDSISEIAEVVLAYEKNLMVNGKKVDPRQAYGALSDQMGELLRAFRDLPGRNVFMSCKQERVKDEATGGMLYAPSMPGAKLGQSIGYLFDEVFVMRVEKDAEGNPQRWLQTASDYNFTAKDRSGRLDPFEAPNLSAIAAKILA